MLLRWLVNQYVGQATRQQLQSVVTDTLRGAAAEAARQTTGSSERAAAGADGRPTAQSDELAPPCDLAVIFALGIESGGTVDKLEEASTTRIGSFTEHAGRLLGKEAVVVESGVGPEAAAKATADVIGFHQPLWVVSAGFAGALDPSLRRGHILMASEVVRGDSPGLSVGFKLHAQEAPWLHVGRLVTTDKLVRTRAEKESLGKQHQALACDMESYAIADVCRQKGVRFLSVRIISDALDDELPKEVERLLAQKTIAGKLGAAAKAVFQRPGSALDFIKLQDDALKASDRLAKFLTGLVVQLRP
jgi:adenosylhomocysteine nucleosidase